jgi:hypothetical protein
MQRPLCSCVSGNYQDELSRFQNVEVDESLSTLFTAGCLLAIFD